MSLIREAQRHILTLSIRWSGLGSYALSLLKANKPPTPRMLAAIHEVCDAAAAKNVGVLPGAEEEATNDGIDGWNMMLQEEYNAPLSSSSTESNRPRAKPGKALMYNTYQSYLRSTPAKLARHLAAARSNGHVLGIKLVRGAYLLSEPASCVWTSKDETDRTYNNLAECLLRGQWAGKLQPCHGSGAAEFPEVDVMFASHNAESIRKIVSIMKERNKEKVSTVAVAQLYGMADELGAEVLGEVKAAEARGTGAPKPVKCATWGNLEDCLNFLLRRAAENRDAAGRTIESRKAMGAELRRRCRAAIGLV